MKSPIIDGLKQAVRHARRQVKGGVEVVLAPAPTEEAIHRTDEAATPVLCPADSGPLAAPARIARAA